MGTKGDKLTSAATEQAVALVDDLAALGDVTSKKMFGGYGIFESGVMFVLIDTEGTAHLRATADSEARYREAGSTKHGRMPYWSIPDDVAADEAKLVEWTTLALAEARAAKKKVKKK